MGDKTFRVLSQNVVDHAPACTDVVDAVAPLSPPPRVPSCRARRHLPVSVQIDRTAI